MASQQGLVDYIKRGTHDDGGEGVVLTKVSQTGLSKYTFVNIGTGGSGSGAGASWGTAQTANNPDGSTTTVTLTAPNGQMPSIAWIENQFWGSRLGVRWLRDSSTARAPFAVIVDGVVRKIADITPTDRVGYVTGSAEYEAAAVVAEDLGPGPHTVRIALYGDPNGTGSRVINLYGLLLESGLGFSNPAVGATLNSGGYNITVPTTDTTIPSTGSARTASLHLYNGNATTAHVVTIKRAGAVYAKRSIPATGDIDISFPAPLQTNNNFTWAVDSGTDVIGYVFTEGAQ